MVEPEPEFDTVMIRLNKALQKIKESTDRRLAKKLEELRNKDQRQETK